jgi:translation initiation factor 1 (eIF-1/SUI1)
MLIRFFSHAPRTHTTQQGIDPTVDYKKVLKAFKKDFCCNGTVVEDPEQARSLGLGVAQRSHIREGFSFIQLTRVACAQGHVIQLQGDQRKNVSTFLIAVRAHTRACCGAARRHTRDERPAHFSCARGLTVSLRLCRCRRAS